MACGHKNTRTDITETTTQIITKVICSCGHVVSTNTATKIKPTQPGTGGK